MRLLINDEVLQVGGGLAEIDWGGGGGGDTYAFLWRGNRESDNVIDLRGFLINPGSGMSATTDNPRYRN